MATADILVSANANRSMIHDEVSTLLRGIKCRDITVQLTGPNYASIEDHSAHSESSSGVRRLAGTTEDDLYSKANSFQTINNYSHH